MLCRPVLMNHIGPLDRGDAVLIARRRLLGPTDDYYDLLSSSAVRRFQYHTAGLCGNVGLFFIFMNPIGCRRIRRIVLSRDADGSCLWTIL